MYYIYHVPGVKIGCTDNLKRRMKDQGFDNYEILEEHDDIEIASEREKELQKEYGYRVDGGSYQHVTKMGKEGAKIGGKISGKKNVESGHMANIGKVYGKIAGKKHVESGHLASIRTKENLSKGGKIGGKITSSKVHTCPHCSTQMKGPNAFRWHFDNCKKKGDPN